MWWTIRSWTHTSFLLEVRQRLQHITFYIDILQFSINENYDKHKKRSCMEVPYSFMTCPGIEPGFTPWEGVVLTAWPTGQNRGDKIRTCDLCVPNAALYQTEPRLDMIRLEANESYDNTFWQNLQAENERKIKKWIRPEERHLEKAPFAGDSRHYRFLLNGIRNSGIPVE